MVAASQGPPSPPALFFPLPPSQTPGAHRGRVGSSQLLARLQKPPSGSDCTQRPEQGRSPCPQPLGTEGWWPGFQSLGRGLCAGWKVPPGASEAAEPSPMQWLPPWPVVALDVARRGREGGQPSGGG